MTDNKSIIIQRFNTSANTDLTSTLRSLFNPWQHLLPYSDGKWQPNTDVFESESHLMIRMELAGVNKKDLEIILHADNLIVFGRREDPYRESGPRFHQMEIYYTEFEKVILLPRKITEEDIEANFEQGMLIIKINKHTSPELEKIHKVKIN